MEMSVEDQQSMEMFIERYFGRSSIFFERIFERVMVFIDGGYWHKCLQDQFGRADIDLTKVIVKLLRGRRLVRTYFYTAKIERPPDEYWQGQQREQQRTLAALARKPFIEARLGRLQFTEGAAPRQKGVDVLLALDMLRFGVKGNYDTAILVSGDGDFADIVRMIKDEGRKVEVVTFPGTRAHALLEACDENIEITAELLEGCWAQ